MNEGHLGIHRDLCLVFVQQLWSMLPAGASGAATEIQEIIPGRFRQIGLNVIAPDEIICQAHKLATECLRFESSNDFGTWSRRALLQSFKRAGVGGWTRLLAGDRHHQTCNASEQGGPPDCGMKVFGIQGN